jgi:hypothetical protein
MVVGYNIGNAHGFLYGPAPGAVPSVGLLTYVANYWPIQG